LSQSITVRADTQEIPIAYQDMVTDPLEYEARVSTWGLWLLIGFFLLLWLLLEALLYLLVKKPLSPQEKAQLRATFRAGDRPPSQIPYPNLNHRIEVSADFYNLAQDLRRRRTGPSDRLDVLPTLQATIRRAGYPQLVYQTLSQAPSYLILIDEHSPRSQQARFFDFISQRLESEDIYLEKFFYQHSPLVCWNARFPQGLSLEQLRQKYPEHRLLIFGSGHGFLDPEEVVVKPSLEKQIRQWPEKALLTPVAVADWSFQEKLIHQLLVVLPVDFRGQIPLTEFLTLPEYNDWEEHRRQFTDGATQPPLHLNTLPDLRAYLKQPADDPHQAACLFHWLCALSVYFQPHWALSLAIGKKLEQHWQAQTANPGFRLVTPENLLQLTRLPVLQQGRWEGTLQEALYEELKKYPELERLSRQAVLEVLEQSPVPPDSFAQREKRTQMAVQEAFLNPQNRQAQSQLRYLWQGRKLPYWLRERLNKKFLPHPGYATLRFATLALLAILSYWGLSSQLRQTPDRQAWGAVAYEHLQDSAVYYNNRAAGLYRNNPRGSLRAVRQNLRLAQTLNPRYLSPHYNKALLHYNLGVHLYQQDSFRLAARTFMDLFRQVTDANNQFDNDAPHQPAWDSLPRLSLYNTALCHYRIYDSRNLKRYADQLDSLDTDFSALQNPNLYTLLEEITPQDTTTTEAEKAGLIAEAETRIIEQERVKARLDSIAQAERQTRLVLVEKRRRDSLRVADSLARLNERKAEPWAIELEQFPPGVTKNPILELALSSTRRRIDRVEITVNNQALDPAWADLSSQKLLIPLALSSNQVRIRAWDAQDIASIPLTFSITLEKDLPEMVQVEGGTLEWEVEVVAEMKGQRIGSP
ncbi:MAG: hypothetical protein HC880_06290, partial [Bacteroidia bacterium]|nr:hypothetical protein [Bacteroidia bacterium]